MNTDITNFLIIFVLIIIALLQVFLILRKDKKDTTQDETLFRMQDKLEHEIRHLNTMMEDRFQSSQDRLHTVLHRQDGDVKKLILDITKEITEVKETNKNVFTITEELSNLKKVLTHQKQRGILGEHNLELILSNVLPPGTYSLQHRFKNGEAVDAVIITKDGMIPVDAKFSLDNYNRLTKEEDPVRKEELEADFKKDLKLRIDETAKYIKEEEGTLPFAFMFVPAEGIYYDLLINEVGSGRNKVNARNLIDYAYKDKKVIIVSPTTFYAYLQSVLYGFRAFKIEESAKQIQGKVEELSRHLNSYEEFVIKMGNSLNTTVNHYNNSSKEFKKIDKDVAKILERKSVMQPILVEKADVYGDEE